MKKNKDMNLVLLQYCSHRKRVTNKIENGVYGENPYPLTI